MNYAQLFCGSIDVGCNGFYVIYGRHGHGYYIAIPNWGVCVEAAEPDNVFYNAESLAGCLDRTVSDCSREIAEAIRDRVPVTPDMHHG